MKKLTLPKCSAQGNRLGAFPGPIESYDPKDGAGKRSSQTNSWLARYFHVKGTKRTNNLVTRKIKLSLQPLATRSKLSTFVTAGVTRKASRTRMMNSSSNEVILPSILQTHSTHHRNTMCVPRGHHQKTKSLYRMHPSSGAGCAEERSDDTKTMCQQLTYLSADSEFIILGPGQARAQKSSESRNFGVIKMLFHACYNAVFRKP